eukprot:s3492_g8.t1
MPGITRLRAGLKHAAIVMAVSSTVVPLMCFLGLAFPEFVVDNGKEPIKNTKRELSEQLYLYAHMARDSRVLFIGGNIGTGCVLADKLLKEPAKSMCVEPSPNVVPILRQNQQKHGATFNILNKLLARPAQGNLSFVYRSMASRIARPGEVADFSVETVDMDLSSFNVLAADCEGCFCEIFRSFKEVAEMELVLLEEDARGLGSECEGIDIYAFLRKAGFTKVNGSVFGGGRPYHSLWSKHPSSMIWWPVYHFAFAAFSIGAPWLSLFLPEALTSSLNVVLSIVLPASCGFTYLAILGVRWLASAVQVLLRGKGLRVHSK